MKLDSLGRRNAGWKYVNGDRGDRAKEFDSYITFMSFKEEIENLDRIAKSKNISRSELIRTYIEWGLESDQSS